MPSNHDSPARWLSSEAKARSKSSRMGSRLMISETLPKRRSSSRSCSVRRLKFWKSASARCQLSRNFCASSFALASCSSRDSAADEAPASVGSPVAGSLRSVGSLFIAGRSVYSLGEVDAEKLLHQRGHVADHRDGPRVVHARRSDDAEAAAQT